MNLPSSDTFTSLVHTVGPTVARVEAPRQAGATGLLWSADGIIVTASHALRRDDPLQVVLGTAAPRRATLLGRDPATDLAVLRADHEGLPDLPDPNAPPAWREAATLGVGELGLALARPGRTVRAALSMISVVGDSLRTRGGRALTPYIELDRMLPRGFSVAPVVDLQGRLLGLATAGISPETAVLLSVDTVRATVEAIVSHGRVPQGYLGVGVSPARLPGSLRESLGQGRALAVVGLAEDGPAADAGLLIGDLILAVDGAAVRSPSGLRAQLADRAGQAVALRLLRGGQATDLQITAGERR
ncbi:MAG: S1C family serine protease [Nannocystaceae bacterium]